MTKMLESSIFTRQMSRLKGNNSTTRSYEELKENSEAKDSMPMSDNNNGGGKKPECLLFLQSL